MTTYLQPFEYLECAARERPFAPAIVSPQSTFTFAQFENISARIAHFLRERGVRPGDVVALNVPNHLNPLFTWAVFHEAAVVCAFHPFMVADRDFIDVTLVVSTVPIDGLDDDRLLLVDGNFFPSLSESDTIDEPIRYESGDSLCRFLFTSGTTGRPKAVAGTVDFVAHKSLSYTDISETENGFMYLGTAADGPGWRTRYFSLINGQPHFVSTTVEQNVDLIAHFRPAVITGSPKQLGQVVDELTRRGITLPSIRAIRSAGSILPAGLGASLAERFPGADIINRYGSTEAGLIAIRHGDTSDPMHMGTIIDGSTIEIVDPETDEPLADGEVGALRVRSVCMATEYYKNPEASAVHFRDGWFYPGEFARREGDQFYLHGRASELINAGGVKVDPSAVDQAMLTIPGIADCATFGLSDQHGNVVIALAYRASAPVDDEHLAANAKALIGASAPTRWFPVDEVPRNDNGKPLRAALTERFSNS